MWAKTENPVHRFDPNRIPAQPKAKVEEEVERTTVAAKLACMRAIRFAAVKVILKFTQPIMN